MEDDKAYEVGYFKKFHFKHFFGCLIQTKT
jgi:hypothetical protein